MANAHSSDSLAPRRRSLPFFAVLVVGFGLVLAVALWPASDPKLQLPFSTEAWRAPGSTQGVCSPRRAMVADLLRRHALVGMKRADVEHLLGPPDYEPWSDLYPGAGYSMGRAYPTSWGDSDSRPLLVFYDASGVVRKVQVL